MLDLCDDWANEKINPSAMAEVLAVPELVEGKSVGVGAILHNLHYNYKIN